MKIKTQTLEKLARERETELQRLKDEKEELQKELVRTRTENRREIDILV